MDKASGPVDDDDCNSSQERDLLKDAVKVIKAHPVVYQAPAQGPERISGPIGMVQNIVKPHTRFVSFFVGHAMDFSIFPARSLICYVVVTRIKTLAFFRPGLVR